MSSFLALADEPVLDFLNTVALVDGQPADTLQSDSDVLAWLKQFGFAVPSATNLKPNALLHATRQLREVVRPLIERRAEGKRIHPEALNDFLAKSPSYLTLTQNKLHRIYPTRTAEQLLTPLAEAAAEFLATADFALVRGCESSDCILWFYDRTKSHQRRWCSMATCGNRHKVAAFRQRQQRA
ncbi:CGNR zinc finger domain-containing protein [Terriglobus saanensis]|uniref:Zinc finger CGNR domain-containing protein n=1 Tax=Terriglobus saanensis (strain ATCC BAA-1853 / DSM 23119 / SP1PR4) TaxID=401053 RepID=E8V5I5_TERSS|nr:ABATE domain-containing protein [Terriglobus saanensis]ADV81519.1 protein of unknown function DUF1470 [Terriglobus saanensis SP1PR4]